LLTFSRTGLYSAGIAIAAALPFFLRSRRFRWQALAAFAALLLLGIAVVFPKLNDFTQGRLKDRFADSRTSGRDQLVLDDLKLWKEHPVLGVGPGVGKWLREKSGTAAHTEYSRLLSEHGAFGLCALAILFLLIVRQIRQATSLSHRAAIVSVLVWGLLFMASDDMRLVAAALALSFGSLQPLGLRRFARREQPLSPSMWSAVPWSHAPLPSGPVVRGPVVFPPGGPVAP
jgi:O-antigen ligase